MTILIVVWRKGATKSQSMLTNKNCYLSICQIFESTDDVVRYHVAEFNPSDFNMYDMYLPNLVGFEKMQPIENKQEMRIAYPVR